MDKWIKITYCDGWYPEGNTCILTDAESRYAGFKYAIFDLKERPHVAIWPTKPIILRAEEVSKEEAAKLMWRSTNGNALNEDFKQKYR